MINEQQKEVIQAVVERYISQELNITYEDNPETGEIDFTLEMTDLVRRILTTLALSFEMKYENMMQEFLQEGLNKKLEQTGH
jgi:hypothetical protein